MIKKLKTLARQAVKGVLPPGTLLSLRVRREMMHGEPELRIVSCISGRSELALDVGANRGTYSYLFSKYTNRVLAFEPHPVLAERLRRALPRSVEVLNYAASDEEGLVDFHIPHKDGKDIDSRCSVEADVNREFTTRTISVERRRLDSLPISSGAVGVVKIDVEGHELSALRGLSGVLQESKPTVIVESEARHHSGAPGNVFEFLAPFGYRGYFVHRGRLRPIEEFSVAAFQPESAVKKFDGEPSPDYINNFLFIHPSRGAVLERVKRIFPPREMDGAAAHGSAKLNPT